MPVSLRPTRRAVLAGAPAALSAAMPIEQNAASPPKVLLVISDQLSWMPF